MNNTKLAIVIPTYERSEIFLEVLQSIVEQDGFELVSVYISDDSVSNDIKDVCSKFSTEYENIIYSQNSPSLGHDRNLKRCLTNYDSDYIWLLGDSIVLNASAIVQVLEIINNKAPALLMVNSGRSKYPSTYKLDFKRFVENNLWHVTMTGMTIYNRRYVRDIPIDIWEGAHNFPQLALIISILSTNAQKCCWIDNTIAKPTIQRRVSYWEKSAYQVFCKDWISVNSRLFKDFKFINLSKVIRSHDKHTNVFSFRLFLKLKLWDRGLTANLDTIKNLYFVSRISVFYFLLSLLLPKYFICVVQKICKIKPP